MPKVEIAPGLFVGSEIGDIDREMKKLTSKLLKGDGSVKPRIRQLSERRMELLMPKLRSKT